MELRLLGAMEAREGDIVVRLGPRQQRLVFAVLAWEVNRLVPVDRLVDLVWPDSDPPASATHAIRVGVSQLRSLLGGSRDVELLTRGPGYLLRADPQLIDVHRFRTLVGRARKAADDQVKVATLDEALGLWRGPALADTASPATRERLCAGVEETRLVAIEDRLDALLRLGRHYDVIDELTTLVETHPTRERLVGQLLLALYRGGQPGQALEVSRRVRGHLADELGIDPGAELQRLEQAILRNDAVLDRPPEPIGHPVPAMLPPMIAGFTGRADHLAKLDAAASADPGGAVVVSVVAGTAGVGKTALAVHWSHRARARFPDGQLYVNLRGYDPDPPLAPAQALFGFLRALGVPPGDVPADLPSATGLYRSVLADKRVLVLLDNAATAEQVRPLLPAGPGCLVVVTSRDRLDGLVAIDAARRMSLDVLSLDEAVALLSRMIGEDRVAAEPDATAELARTCACLPLALRIAAAQLAGRPDRIEEYVARLRQDPLPGLALDGDATAAVRAAFDLSYSGLTEPTRRMFRLLGVLPGPDISTVSAAALAGTSPEEAGLLLDGLLAAHLVEQRTPGRYTLHDLLRDYASRRAEDIEGTAALARLTAHYLQFADAAARLLYPHLLRLPVPDVNPALPPVGFDDHAGAVAWFDAERPNLVAAVGRVPAPWTWLLADALRGYFNLRREFPDWLAVARHALSAAETADDPRAQASALFSLGLLHYGRNEYAESAERYQVALKLCQDGGWLLGQAGAVTNLALIAEERGDLEQAIADHTRALELDRQAEAPLSMATALTNIGRVQEQRGRLDLAVARYQEALTIQKELGSRAGEASALHFLASCCHLLGDLDMALTHITDAVAMFREIGARNEETQSLYMLSLVERTAGRRTEALEAAQAAVSLAARTSDQRTIAGARAALGDAVEDPRQALGHYRAALDMARTVNARRVECRVLLGIAEANVSLGKPAEALDSASKALASARAAGYRLLEGLALTGIAEAHAAAGRSAEGTEAATQALAMHRETGHRIGEERTQALLATLQRKPAR
jgi:DNA-binding SARP family transcriptional activator/tetratricopeptide (TPR) repeat protein